MAGIWLAATGFESSSLTNCLGLGGGSASSCTASGPIDCAHFTDLARYGMAPYRGSYCARVKLTGGTTDGCIKELTLMDQATTPVTSYTRFYFYLGKDLVMANADKFSLIELESVSNTTTRAAVGVQRTSDNLELWWNVDQATAVPSTVVLGTTSTALGLWRYVEMVYKCSIAAAGTLDVYLDGGSTVAATGLSSLNQAAIVDGKIGVIGPDAGTSGTVLIDDVIITSSAAGPANTSQIYPNPSRFVDTNKNAFFASDHPILGPAEFAVGMTGSSTDGKVVFYDSDGIPPAGTNPFLVLGNSAANEFVPGHDLFQVDKGLYVVMTGTQPQCFLSVNHGGFTSEAALIDYGRMTTIPRV